MTAFALVLNARPLWVRLLFREFGNFTPTTGVVFHQEKDAPVVTEQDLTVAPGWTLEQVKIPRRSFGRLAALFAPWIFRKLKKQFGCPEFVVFTSPDQRHLCRYFDKSRRIYYVTDDFRRDYGWSADLVESWERMIAENVEQIVCVSRALAHFLAERLPVEEKHIVISPNGVPQAMIPEEHVNSRPCVAARTAATNGPVAGILGTINGRVRLDWLRGLVDALPWLNLLLVGPVGELNDAQRDDWSYLAAHSRCEVVGPVSYYELFEYASRIDLGLIPLTNDGINPACSPIRFFTQLPFGQPIVASESSLQLQEFEPLVVIVKSFPELVSQVEKLHKADFDDGLVEQRRQAARNHTWETRAESLYRQLVNH